MKKRVRIYKPTNKFAAGGQQSAQFTPDQLTSIYMTALSEPGSSIEDAENALRQIGVDEDTVTLISNNTQEFVNDQQYLNESLTTADEDAYADITADEAAIDSSVAEEQSALERAEEEARSDAMQQMYADYNEPDYSDDTEAASQIIERNGGVPSKRTFVKNVLKQVKKQMGGDSQQSRVDSTDPDNKRKDGLAAFTTAVETDGSLNLAKQDAEEMYKMLTTPIGGDESYYQEQDMDYAQFGGMRRGQMRRMNRRMNRMVGQLPIGFAGMPGGPMLPGAYDYTDLVGAFGQGQMPADGSYYRGPKMANIDVRRTGLFGRPKEYSITFADDVANNPQTAENTIKQEIINKEEEIKDEVKAAEEGTVDQGVEEKKQTEAEAAAQTAADEVDVDINDIQVVSGKGSGSGKSGSGAASSGAGAGTEEYTPSKASPSFKGFWKGYDPSSVRFAGQDKSRAYIQRGNKWFVSPNFTTKDKKNVQWYEVSDPNRVKNIERSTKPSMAQLAPGSTYTMSDANPGPMATGRSSAPVYGSQRVPLNQYITSKEFLNSVGNDIKGALNPENLRGFVQPTNMNVPVSRTAPRQTIGLGEKFQGGGFTDQDSGLYKFLYGGDDQGELTGDPYFAYGGYLPQAQAGMITISDGKGNTKLVNQEDAETWNQAKIDTPDISLTDLSFATDKPTSNRQSGRGADFSQKSGEPGYMGYGYGPAFRTKQRGMPYMTGSNQTYTGALDNAKLKSIDVKKTKAFGPYKGMPKKYTVNYQVERDPLSKRLNFTDAGMTLDGRSMDQVAPTRQGLFNRSQSAGNQSSMNQDRLDMFLNKDFSKQSRRRGLTEGLTAIAPRLGSAASRLFGDGYEQYQADQKVLQAPGQISNRETRRLQKNDLYEDYLKRFAQQNPPISDKTFAFNQSTPVVDTEFPEIQNAGTFSDMAGYSLPTRDAQAIQGNEDELIPQRPVESPIGSLPTRSAQPLLLPSQTRLAPGQTSPMYYDQASEEDAAALAQQQREQDLRGSGLGLLGLPTAQDEYMQQVGDQGAYDLQQAELQRMMEQNPDFYGQQQYNWEPGQELLGSASTPVLTPQEAAARQQQVIAQQRAEAQRRAAAQASIAQRNLGQKVQDYGNKTVPTKSNVTKPQRETSVTPRDTNQTTQQKVAVKRNEPVKPVVKQETAKTYIKPTGSVNYGGADKAQAAEDAVRKQKEETAAKRKQFEKSYGVDKATLELFRSLRGMEGTEAQQRAMLEKYPGLKKYYKPSKGEYGGYMAYGGTMTMPKAYTGYDNDLDEDTPVNYDPRFRAQQRQFDLGSSELDNPFVYSGQNQLTNEKSGVKMGTEGSYVNEGVVPKEDLTDFSQRKEYDDVSVDYNTKGDWDANAAKRRLLMDWTNAAGNTIAGWFDSPRQDKSWRNEDAQASIDKGWIITNSGLETPDMGQRQSVKYGGGIYQQGGPIYDHEIGEYMWMTPEMIQKFLEDGGELEYV